MAGLFDDLPDAKSGADAGLFDDIPDAQPVKPEPVQSGFFSQLLADIKGLFSKPPSVLESAPADPQAFDFKGASALARRQDDAAARVAQHGSMGPITGPQASASSVASGLAGSVRAGALRARAGINQAAADAVGGDAAAHYQRQARRDLGRADIIEGSTTPEFDSSLASGIYSGLASTAQMAAPVAAALLTRNPGVALTGMVAPMVPGEYAKFRGQGADPLKAGAAATAMSATEWLTEKMPMGVIVNKMGKEGAKRFLAELLAKEVPGEQVATIVQDAIDVAAGDSGKTWGQYLQERPDAALQTLIATLTQASLMGGAHKAIQRLGQPTAGDEPTLADYQAAAARVFGTPAQAGANPANPLAAPAQGRQSGDAVARVLAAIEQAVPGSMPATVAPMPQPAEQAAQPPAVQPPAPDASEAAADAAPTASATPAGIDTSAFDDLPDATGTPAHKADAAQPDARVAMADQADANPDVAVPQQALASAPMEPVRGSDPVGTTRIEQERAQDAAQHQAAQAQRAIEPVQDDGPVGVDFTPIAQGGKPFKTDRAAKAARKMQPHLRVVRSKDGAGFVLVPKTERQLAAEARAARRIALPRTGQAGAPLSAHGFIIDKGGLDGSLRSELSIDGNPRFGNRFLFAGKGRPGLSLARAAELLYEAGYIQEESERAAADIIQRSIRTPQYTAEGWERIAQAEADARFEDYRAAAQEEGDPLMLDEADLQELRGAGITRYDDTDLQALIAQAEAAGIDTEVILEEAARITENGTQDEYIAAARKALTDAIHRAAGGGGLQQAGGDAGQGRQPEQAQRGDDAGSRSGDGGSGAARYPGGPGGLAAEADGLDSVLVAKEGRSTDQPDLFNDQLDLFLDSRPVETQAGPGVDAARQEAAEALRDIRDMGNPLAMALSSDFAARQRVSLVGQTARTPEEFATLAQVYRDPRFETFRVVFVNDDGKIVSQMGLTSRLPGSAAAIIGSDVNGYLERLMEAAKSRGATGYYMLHNHPSGNPTPSSADESLTRAYSGYSHIKGGPKFKGHVVIDTNKYAVIDEMGKWEVHQKDFGQPEPYGGHEWAGASIGGPSDAMEMAKRLQVDDGVVTLIAVNSQGKVVGVTTIPSASLGMDSDRNHRTLAKAVLSMKGYRVIAVSRSYRALRAISGMALDAVHVSDSGQVRSLIEMREFRSGDTIPNERSVRVSPDTGPEFKFLRKMAWQENKARAKMKGHAAGRAARDNQDGDYDLDFTKPAAAPGEGARADRAGRERLAGKELGTSVAGTPAPAGWAGATALRRDGKPVTIYRGAGRALTAQDFELAALGRASEKTAAGLGVFFTSGREEARSYADTASERGGSGLVEPFHLDIRKPYVISPDALPIFESKEDANRYARKLQEQGYDSIIIDARKYGKKELHFVVFRPEQVIYTGHAAEVREDGPDYGDDLDLGPESKRTSSPDAFQLKDLFGFERDAAGRRVWKAGRKGYDAGMDFARSILGKIKLMDTKPGAFRELMRKYQADNYRAQQAALKVAQAGKDMPKEMRALLSDFIEKEVDLGDNPPQAIADMAAAMSAAFERQAQDLIELGMMSPDRKVANYLPRVYRNPLIGKLQSKDQIAGWLTKARLRIRGERLKSRGLTSEVPPGRVKDMERLGWRLSSMPDGSPIPVELRTAIEKGLPLPERFNAGQKVLMWRDFTKTEREQMGEVRDAILRFALGYVETQKDLALGRLFKGIASNPDLASMHNPGGWVKVPDREIHGSNGVKMYGMLSGMYVHPQVADQLKRAVQDNSAIVQAYDRAMSLWKEGKTVWNPVAHGNNVVSNLFMAHFAGINIANPRVWREVMREYRTKGPLYQEAVENGLLGTEFANAEIQQALMPELREFMTESDVVASRATKMAEFLKKYPGKPVSWYREKMRAAYEFEDQIFKLMVYIDRRKAGATPGQAVDDAERYFFNYADVPEGVRTIQRVWSPFFSYTYNVIPSLLYTAATRPDRIILPMALLGGANWLAYAMLGDDADEDEERKNMPDYMKGRTALGSNKMVRLPINSKDGNPYFLDMSRRVPGGDLLDFDNQMGGMPWAAPFMPSHPVLHGMYMALWGNKDTFTGREIVKESDTEWEAAKKRAIYLYRQIVPNAVFVPGSHSANKAMDAAAAAFDTDILGYTGFNSQGDKANPVVNLLDIAGIAKVRESNTERNATFRALELKKQMDEVRSNIVQLNRRERNGNILPAEHERELALQREKLERLREKLAATR